jgi:hypothetical protein
MMSSSGFSLFAWAAVLIPRRIPADDYESFLCHSYFTSIQKETKIPRTIVCVAQYKLLMDGCQRERKTFTIIFH